MDIVHRDKDFRLVLCRPDKRKNGGLFPKWWCFVCNKYILPDGKKHFTLVESRQPKEK